MLASSCRRALFGLLLATSACRATAANDAQQAASKPTVSPATAAKPAEITLTPAGRDPVSVQLEVVQTPDARQRGLMFRKQLDPSAGMLFVFEQPEPHTFWMHNTLVPLDMIFITADWSVLGVVENATPLTDAPRAVPGSSQYVLEVNAGFSRRYGVVAGTAVRYSPATP
jgi:uncharacterized membrane protein (UPF0127 family)